MLYLNMYISCLFNKGYHNSLDRKDEMRWKCVGDRSKEMRSC